MDSTPVWMVPLLGGVVGIGLVAAWLVRNLWRRRSQLSAEELAELAEVPMPKLQKRALISLVLGLITLGTISAILSVYGAAEYWDNDDLRLTVVGIFIAGLAIYTGLLVTMVNPLSPESSQLDERDRQVLGQAPVAQSALVIIALAAWMVSLGQRFHDQGAVPMVYLYLIFGTVVLVNWIGHAAGIVVGYWMGARFGEG